MRSLLNNFLEKLYGFWKYIKHPGKLIYDFCVYDDYRYAKFIPDKLFLKCIFKKYMKAELNLKNPVTFSEKLQWLKLYDRKSQYSIMADKAEVKKYVASIIGEEHIIPTIGIYDNVDDIPFSDLPEKFVIKCTHDSGSTTVCDKSNCDFDEIKKVLSEKLKINFFWYAREWAYKNVKPRIIIEKFISDENGNCPVDYKFFCFNGKMEIFKIDYNRFTKRAANYYDKNCSFMQIGKIHSIPDPSIKLELPANFQEMVKITEILSEGIPFLRVDLYSVKDQIFFGELTFFPSGGIEPFVGDGDKIMGDLLILPDKIMKE